MTTRIVEEEVLRLTAETEPLRRTVAQAELEVNAALKSMGNTHRWFSSQASQAMVVAHVETTRASRAIAAEMTKASAAVQTGGSVMRGFHNELLITSQISRILPSQIAFMSYDIIAFTRAVRAAKIETIGFTAALLANPYGQVLVGLALVTAAVLAFTGGETEAEKKAKDFNKQLGDLEDHLQRLGLVQAGVWTTGDLQVMELAEANKVSREEAERMLDIKRQIADIEEAPKREQDLLDKRREETGATIGRIVALNREIDILNGLADQYTYIKDVEEKVLSVERDRLRESKRIAEEAERERESKEKALDAELQRNREAREEAARIKTGPEVGRELRDAIAAEEALVANRRRAMEEIQRLAQLDIDPRILEAVAGRFGLSLPAIAGRTPERGHSGFMEATAFTDVARFGRMGVTDTKVDEGLKLDRDRNDLLKRIEIALKAVNEEIPV